MSDHWEEPAWAAECRAERDKQEEIMDELEKDISLLESILEVLPVNEGDDSSWTNGGIAPQYEKKYKALYNIRDILTERLERKQEQYGEAEHIYNRCVEHLWDL